MTDASRLRATIYVSGLDNAVDDRVLIDAFLPYGEVVDVTIPKPEAPSSNDPHRGFGYVEFETPADAKEAIENMDQSELFGRVIKVAPSKPQKSSNDGLGSKQAVWEQEGYLAKHGVSEEDKIAIGKETQASDEDEQSTRPELQDFDLAGPQLP